MTDLILDLKQQARLIGLDEFNNKLDVINTYVNKFKEAIKILVEKKVNMIDLYYCYENKKHFTFYNYFQEIELEEKEFNLLIEVLDELQITFAY